ncbi:hypothetical protein [Paraburkholderia sp. J41]|uniref:hypothetical protein n=1 Tax=Paraburkholderia sp. J41 TaxID=2805433 RepID=UPI002AC3263C|nr:hypothetical protein [Paraburkholderia sp. J41]
MTSAKRVGARFGARFGVISGAKSRDGGRTGHRINQRRDAGTGETCRAFPRRAASRFSHEFDAAFGRTRLETMAHARRHDYLLIA